MTGGAEGCEGRRTKEWERVDVPRALWRFERRGCGGCEVARWSRALFEAADERLAAAKPDRL